MAAQTCLRATALYTDLLSEPVRISSKWNTGGAVAALRWCWDKSLIDPAFVGVSHAEADSEGRTRMETRTLSSLLPFEVALKKFASTSPEMSAGSTVSQSTSTSSGSTLLTSISLRSSWSGSSSPCRGVRGVPGVLGRDGSRLVGVPGAGWTAGGLVFTVVLVRVSDEMAAVSFLAEANGFIGVEERIDPEVEVERERLGVNKEVGRRRRLGP